MRGGGSIAGALGVVITFASFVMKTSVSTYGGEVNNLGLLQQQMMVFHVGLALTLVGAVLYVGGAVSDAVSNGDAGPGSSLEAPIKQTPAEAREGNLGEASGRIALMTPEEEAREKRNLVMVYVAAAVLLLIFLIFAFTIKPASSDTPAAESASSNFATDDALMANDVTVVDPVNLGGSR